MTYSETFKAASAWMSSGGSNNQKLENHGSTRAMRPSCKEITARKPALYCQKRSNKAVPVIYEAPLLQSAIRQLLENYKPVRKIVGRSRTGRRGSLIRAKQ
jgi:hypothetical protein